MAEVAKVPVIEIGAWYTKCGFAGDGAPKHIVFKHLPQRGFKPQNVATGAPRPLYEGLGLSSGADGKSAAAKDGPVQVAGPWNPKSKEDWKPLLRRHLDEIFFRLLLCDPKDKQAR